MIESEAALWVALLKQFQKFLTLVTFTQMANVPGADRELFSGRWFYDREPFGFFKTNYLMNFKIPWRLLPEQRLNNVSTMEQLRWCINGLLLN